MKSFTVDIVAKDEKVYSGEAEYLQLPGWEGDIGIMAGHTELISMIRPGVCILRNGKEEYVWAMSEGFASITGDKVTLAVGFAFLPDEIDDESAEEMYKKASEDLRKKSVYSETDEKYLEFKRAEICLKVDQKYLHKDG